MSKRANNYKLMGKFFYIISAELMIAALVTNLLPPRAVLADSQGKVYVCKYVGTPGIDERLLTGQNPIEVSVNAIQDPVVIGAYFADAQGRSYVLGFVPMVPEPTSVDCPPASASELTLSKSASPMTYSQVGETITYNYLVKNNGNTPLTGVSVIDDKATVGCGGVTNLAVGASMVCTATYAIIQTDLDAGSVINLATADSNETNPITATATVTYVAVQNKKVYVCKYVGTPGIDERLQTGQNPIEVSVNAIQDPVVIGAYFADAQGRSYVLGFVPMVPEPTSADCPSGNANASISLGACSWTQAAGSSTPVALALTGASLTINSVTYTASQTINLAPGSYTYTWTALSGYTGSGSGTVVIGDCTPGNANASISLGACSWTQAAGSSTPVTLALTGASLIINTVTYTASQIINLAPGSYTYTWTALSGYSGSGSGTVVIGDCTTGNANASISLGACSWTQAAGSSTPVTLALTSASLMINTVTYTASQTINLAPGSYTYTWTALNGYTGSGSGTVVIGDCTTGNANASISLGACSWTQAAGSSTPVTLTLTSASLTINTVTYTASQTINLAPGSYTYTWTALSGYTGSGSGTVVIGDCTTILIPVTGVDMGLLGRTLSGSFFGLSLCFAGLGTVLVGLTRRHLD